MHLSGFSARCLSAFLPVSLAGQGACPAEGVCTGGRPQLRVPLLSAVACSE